jgi:prepilin-type N-terminal cleavage/methylation domain-containing protein
MLFINISRITKASKKAFTLAEVLITLGLIGIIAALTMPALVVKYQEKVTVTRVKKGYSILSQAFQMAVNEHGDPTNWDLGAYDNLEGARNGLSKLSQYINTVKECQNGATVCDTNVAFHLINGTIENITSHFAFLSLADGSTVLFASRGQNCENNRGTGALANICAFIYVDTNGSSSPNTYGKDVFGFYMTKTGIIPIGTSDEKMYQVSQCLSLQNGAPCTAWVLLNENLDYLHCSGLSVGGKTKCD